MTWVNVELKGQVVNASVILLDDNGRSWAKASERTVNSVGFQEDSKDIKRDLERVSNPANVPAGNYKLRLFGLSVKGALVQGNLLINGQVVNTISNNNVTDLNKVPAVNVSIPDLNNEPLEPIFTFENISTTTIEKDAPKPFAVIHTEDEKPLTKEEFVSEFGNDYVVDEANNVTLKKDVVSQSDVVIDESIKASIISEPSKIVGLKENLKISAVTDSIKSSVPKLTAEQKKKAVLVLGSLVGIGIALSIGIYVARTRK